MDDILEKLSHELLSELTSHEAYLSNLLDLKQDVNEEEYGFRHKKVAMKFIPLKKGIHNLKTAIFAFVRENAVDRCVDSSLPIAVV